MTKKKPAKKMHAADIATRDAIAGAADFTVYQYRRDEAPFKCEGVKTLTQAVVIADQVYAGYPLRGVIVYANVAGISHPVPADMVAAARGAKG